MAPLGTALTEDHLTLLWRMSDAPVLCFDGDSAGQKAAERSADMVLPLLKPGQTVRIATLPDGLDPDDLIRQQGRDAFADLIETAQPLSEMIWTMETRGVVPETPEARAALEARLQGAGGLDCRQFGQTALRAGVRRKAECALCASLRQVPALGRRARAGWWPRLWRRAKGKGSGHRRLVVSRHCAISRLLKRGRVVDVTAREATILMSLVNHPGLAEITSGDAGGARSGVACGSGTAGGDDRFRCICERADSRMAMIEALEQRGHG